MSYTPLQIQESYKKLSQETREVIASTELTNIINDITKSYNLTTKQTSDTGQLVIYVLMNLESKDDLTKKIKENLLVDENVSINLAQAIQNKILNNLENIHETIQNNIETEGGEENQEIKGETKVTIDNRIAEIGKKYSLNNAQLDVLINKVGIAIKYPAQKSGLVQTLVTGLTISKLLAEQIMADLETRVFEYAINQIESKNKTEKEKLAEPIVKKEEVKPTPVVVEVKKAPEVAPNIPTAPTVPKVPEVAPQNLPMVENPGTRAELSTGQRNEQVKVLPTLKTILEKKPEPKPEVTVETKPEVKIAPIEKPEEGNKIEIKKPEPIQRPIPVPRFTAVPLPEETDTTLIPIRTPTPAPAKATEPAPIPQPQPAPTPVTPPVSPATPAPEKPAETKPAEPIVKKYVVDPYREPLN